MTTVPVESLVEAARELTRAGRWAAARDLLAAAHEADPAEHEVLDLQRAEVEVDRAFWAGEEPLLSPEPVHGSWAASFLLLRADYARQLRRVMAGDSVAAPEVGLLRRRAAKLYDDGEGVDRASIAFYRGLIEEVLADDPAAAGRHYEAALDGADDYWRSFALRHLGGLRDDEGDHVAAVELWRESTLLRQRVGFVPGALAQLALLQSELGVSQVIGMWGRELGIGWLADADAAAD